MTYCINTTNEDTDFVVIKQVILYSRHNIFKDTSRIVNKSNVTVYFVTNMKMYVLMLGKDEEM